MSSLPASFFHEPLLNQGSKSAWEKCRKEGRKDYIQSQPLGLKVDLMEETGVHMVVIAVLFNI